MVRFLIQLFSRVLQNTLSIIPSLYLIDYLRPIFKSMSIPKASMYVLALLMVASTISMILVMLVMINIGWFEYDRQTFILNILFDAVISGGFTLVFLLYFYAVIARRMRSNNRLSRN